MTDTGSSAAHPTTLLARMLHLLAQLLILMLADLLTPPFDNATHDASFLTNGVKV
jgi:hypothetical protein